MEGAGEFSSIESGKKRKRGGGRVERQAIFKELRVTAFLTKKEKLKLSLSFSVNSTHPFSHLRKRTTMNDEVRLFRSKAVRGVRPGREER